MDWETVLPFVKKSVEPIAKEGDPFVDMRLNAGTFQNIRHLHLKVWLNRLMAR